MYKNITCYGIIFYILNSKEILMIKNVLIKKITVTSLLALSIITIVPKQANAAWKKDNKGWWYSKGNTYLKNCSEWIDNNIYFFNNNGYLKTGWVKDDYDTWYYYYSNGTMAKDATINGYYLTNRGNMLEGVSKADIDKYIQLIEKNLPKDIKVINLKDYITTAKDFKPVLYNLKISKALIFNTFEHLIDESEEDSYDFNIYVDLDTNKVYAMDGGMNLYECKDGERLRFKPIN